MSAYVLRGDCLAVMGALRSASVDSIVCDPPYALTSGKKGGSGQASVNLESPYGRARIGTGNGGGGFMGKAWDASLPGVEVWAEALRIAKPGAYLVAFGGPRTSHRLVSAIEDAGWEIRDSLCWLFGSGFPKSHNLPGGLGTALKPAHEPICLARKPLGGTVAANVAEYGTGALNIDATRIGGPPPSVPQPKFNSPTGAVYGFKAGEGRNGEMSQASGRWPANVVLSHSPECREVGTRKVRGSAPNGPNRGRMGYHGSGVQPEREPGYTDADGMETVTAWDCAPDCAVRLLDDQSGTLTSGANPTSRSSDKFRTAYGDFEGQRECVAARGVDVGGASRFFYTAKAARSEREAGLDGGERKAKLWSSGEQNPGSFQAEGTDRTSTNHHPTVKPLDLMRWLCRLVTPPGGLILDPFTGSGSTGCAAVLEGFRFIGIEREAEYVAIARRRIAHWLEQFQPGLFDSEPAA